MVHEVVQLADHTVRPLPAVPSLVTEAVDLARKSFTVDPKHCTLARGEEVYWAGLERVVHLSLEVYVYSWYFYHFISYLLGIVKTKVDLYWHRVQQRVGVEWWWPELVGVGVMCPH